MFSLDTIGEWEDLILDKAENTAIVSRSTWCDKLISLFTSDANNEKNTIGLKTMLKLDDIRHVGATLSMGLYIVSRYGKTICLDTRGLSRQEIQDYRKSINYFLNMRENSGKFVDSDRAYDEIIVATSESESQLDD